MSILSGCDGRLAECVTRLKCEAGPFWPALIELFCFDVDSALPSVGIGSLGVGLGTIARGNRLSRTCRGTPWNYSASFYVRVGERSQPHLDALIKSNHVISIENVCISSIHRTTNILHPDVRLIGFVA